MSQFTFSYAKHNRMKNIVKFLEELSEHNNRDWFQANKQRYKEVQEEFNLFTTQLVVRIGEFDHTISGLTIAECTYRIYRDTRFSPDKTPYKTHIGAYICPAGKKSGYAGYYLHIEPYGKSILAAGLHCPEPSVVKSVREEIFTNGNQLIKSITDSGFMLDESSKLSRPPKGYSADNEYIEYLKLKEFDLIKSVTEQQLFQADVLNYIVSEFTRCKEFNAILNRAVEYVKQGNI